ncbi:P-loop containing nucleoside triphosphate hydrolase protein [Chaetomidium leptoderma]|uniref:P-loop containing nucleoside triphosphate hydrolase protein n=1 Tax=Chaetomidium leptoderma TaxID=669021 RepID=A0AAN6ZVJ5_9PEZI|nr:P-loop containing nucleoside triphosphate hydrolase protein [Chaetomidium leptoderma]
MPPTELRRHVAAGCLALDKTKTGIPDDVWSLVEPKQWLHLGPFGNLDAQKTEGQENVNEPPDLLPSLDSSEQVIARVYLLPDDVDNRTIPRSDSSLRKARLGLLAQLDFSKNTWRGHVSALRSPTPPLFGSSETASNTGDGEDQSLLQMFNSIPSPNPSPDAIHNFDARDAAYTLISSKVPGLTTTLYPYQRRSASLMLQRESERQQVLDPRLAKAVDQLGTPWYYDAVTGTSLREPRHYDAPCGGILAEEMGSGKTLICLALILATRHIPSSAPEHLRTDEPVIRRKVGSLVDMAAACITRNSVPWKTVFGALGSDGIEYPLCVGAIRRNPAFYSLPLPARRRESRQPTDLTTPATVFLSHSSLVIVPANLVQQWKQEIAKHTLGLKVFIADKGKELPPVEELVDYDIVLFSSTRFEKLGEDLDSDRYGSRVLRNSLARIRFKRCIVDEGHMLGNSTMGRKSNMHLIIDNLQISAKWIVTGTPSKGLFGMDDTPSPGQLHPNRRQVESSADLEKDDLRRIGSIAKLYLHMRPWANQRAEAGDSPADWAVYVMQPRHSTRSTGRADCLKATLESLIIRHRLSEVGDLLPSVNEKIIYLDGSFQDRLVLNLFSMMIIFNAVQSQRTDQDYFFHPRQRKALLELVSNLRQASFFGGSFFSPPQIRKAVDTAVTFLEEGRVQISAEDEALLRDAIELGRQAMRNDIKRCANLFREVPLYVQNFPWDAGREWSLDLEEGDPVCTDSRMISALQKFLHPVVDAPTSLQVMFDSGRFAERGLEERSKGIEEQDPEAEQTSQPETLAGNTQLGQDSSSPRKRRSAMMAKGSRRTGEAQAPVAAHASGTDIAPPLAQTQLVSTASAKLSYLIDQIVEYQESEQIIVFYENDNVAYYLAGVLEILQIEHLIYAKGLTTERRAQYVATFNHNPKFRVLLMDITQAAFGLDMKSASRIYFINPVLNPQVEAQAIGRARRISQHKPVTVETLVLRGSVEEVIVRRRAEMTLAEQRRCRRSILDDRPIYEWILEARILAGPPTPPPPPLVDRPVEAEAETAAAGPEQMAKLRSPQFVFGRGFGRARGHPDQDLVAVNRGSLSLSPPVKKENGGVVVVVPERGRVSLKRPSPPSGPVTSSVGTPVVVHVSDGGVPVLKKARVRFAESGDEGGG